MQGFLGFDPNYINAMVFGGTVGYLYSGTNGIIVGVAIVSGVFVAATILSRFLKDK